MRGNELDGDTLGATARELPAVGRTVAVVGLAICLTMGLAGAPCGAASGAEVPHRGPGFLPLGVYWPGEYVFRRPDKTFDWPKNEAILDGLAAHHCNTIWLTHTSAEEAAEFARRSVRRGIYLVASLGELNGGERPHRTGDIGARRERILKVWGDAPPPIAWGLADEPRTSYMREMGDYTRSWMEAGQPVTTVVMAGDIPAAGEWMRQSVLCTDIYPFFSKNNPNGPDSIAESWLYMQQAGRRAHHWSRANGTGWWYMGAIFQEPWGPNTADEHGNIVYVPGSGPHFRMPTPQEVKWQTWAALACGTRGVIYFSLIFAPQKPGPDPEPAPKEKWHPFGVAERTNSGSPGGILYPDGRPTPQYEAMGEAFGEVARLASVLTRVEPVEDYVAFHAKGWIPPGDIVQVMRDAGTGARYVLVVNGEVEQNVRKHVPVNLAPEVVAARDLRTGEELVLHSSGMWEWEPVAAGHRQVRVTLEPGDGTLLELTAQ